MQSFQESDISDPHLAEIQLFNESDYFKQMHDGGIKLEKEGIKLICEYYQFKYNITIEFIDATEDKDDHDLFTTFLKRIQQLLPQMKQEKDDYRIGFLLGLSAHTTPIFFLKEDDEMGFLIADSLGGSQSSAAALNAATRLPVYWIEDPRQHDKYSCYADGVVTIKDITRKKPNSNDYYYSHVLNYFASFAEDLDHSDAENDDYLDQDEAEEEQPKYRPTLFPAMLLKVPQLNSFMAKHDLGTNLIVHKGERIKDFRKRYTNQQGFPSYLFEKGIKFSHLIPLQFYLNQVRDLLKDKWNDDLTNEFIKKGKEVIRALGADSRLAKFSRQFLLEMHAKKDVNNPSGKTFSF